MAEVLTLEVATPLGLALQTEAESVQAPSVQGEFGVLPGHLPLLAALQCGLLKYQAGGKTHVAAIGPGFVEAEPDRVRVLTDAIATPDKIDLDEARKELAEAQRALGKFDKRHEGPEFAELDRRVQWATARINAYEVAAQLS